MADTDADPTSSDHVFAASGPDGEWARDRAWRTLVDTAKAGLLFVSCVGIGFACNGLRDHPVPLIYLPPSERMKAVVTTLRDGSPQGQATPDEAVKPKPRIIDLEAFQALVFDHGGVVIDARAAAFYRLGRVPGALSLPREEFSTVYPTLAASLEIQKGKKIAVYCSEVDCPDAGLVADALIGLGYSAVLVYQDGWEEWVRAGLPQESGGQ